MVPKHNNNQVVGFHPEEEAKGLLGSVPMLLSCYAYPFASFSHLVYLFCLFRPLLCLCLHRPHCHPLTLQVQASMFSPYLCYLRSQTLLRLQTQFQYQTSRDMFGDGVLAAEDVLLHLLHTRQQHCRCHH